MARPIAKTLKYLALVLIQAGASIRHGICTSAGYLDVFASYRTQIMKDDFVQRSSYVTQEFELGTQRRLDPKDVHVLRALPYKWWTATRLNM